MRTDDPADPSSWRYWNGSDFAGQWKNPYLEPVDPTIDKGAPVAFSQLSGSINEGIVFDEELGLYVMVGAADSAGAGGADRGFHYSVSPDLTWSARRLLIDLPINPSIADPDNDTSHAYPTIIENGQRLAGLLDERRPDVPVCVAMQLRRQQPGS